MSGDAERKEDSARKQRSFHGGPSPFRSRPIYEPCSDECPDQDRDHRLLDVVLPVRREPSEKLENELDGHLGCRRWLRASILPGDHHQPGNEEQEGDGTGQCGPAKRWAISTSREANEVE